MRLSTLADFGGYAAIESAIGDDVVLMERIHALGGVARPIPHAVLTRSADTTLASLVARMTRWLRVIRAQRPYLLLTYPTLIAPLPLAITLALTTSQRGPWAWACVGFLLAARTLLAVALALGPYRGGRAMRSAFATPLLAVLADAVLLVAFLAALAERRILWAGRIYDVRSGGRISGVRST